MEEYFATQLEHEILSHEEIIGLINKAKIGDESSRNKIIKHNMKYIVKRAKKYAINSQLSLKDLVHEGIIGLIKAVDKFDDGKGIKFLTYATWWINQSMDRAEIDKGKTIRISNDAEIKIRNLKKIYQNMSYRLQRNPTVEELSNKTGYKIEKIKEYLSIINRKEKSFEYLSEIKKEIDFIDENTPENIFFQKELEECLNNFLENYLGTQELNVIRRRYLKDIPETLEEIGIDYGVTRERIRQIEVKALLKINEHKEELAEVL